MSVLKLWKFVLLEGVNFGPRFSSDIVAGDNDFDDKLMIFGDFVFPCMDGDIVFGSFFVELVDFKVNTEYF